MGTLQLYATQSMQSSNSAHTLKKKEKNSSPLIDIKQ